MKWEELIGYDNDRNPYCGTCSGADGLAVEVFDVGEMRECTGCGDAIEPYFFLHKLAEEGTGVLPGEVDVS